MAQNFPGPYELRIAYTTTPTGLPTLPHTQRLNLNLTSPPNPGDAFNNINAVTRGGISTPDLASAVEAWLGLVDNLYHTSATFGPVELWSYAPLSFDAQFISSYNPTISAGVETTAAAPAGQHIMTFRSQEGGIMRLSFMEPAGVLSGAVDSYPTGFPNQDAVFAFVIGSTNWILARDTSYPFAALKLLQGQNEKTFRQRFR